MLEDDVATSARGLSGLLRRQVGLGPRAVVVDVPLGQRGRAVEEGEAPGVIARPHQDQAERDLGAGPRGLTLDGRRAATGADC